MQELYEQIWSVARGIWLKKRYIVVFSWLVCISGWIAITTLPDQYSASARVYVNTQSLLKPLLRGLTISANQQQQVHLMVKTLLSRPNVEKILRMVDMDILASNQKEFEQLVDRLAKNIKITATSRENLYTISYSGNNPEQATNVVKAVLKVFMENTVGQTRSDTVTARNFLDDQINEYEQRLTHSEQQLTEFKQLNGHLIISSGDGYYKTLKQYQDNFEISQLLLQEKLTQLKLAKSQLIGESPAFGILNPVINRNFPSEYDARISQLEQSLDQLVLRYTQLHPDVKEVQQRIYQLKRYRRKELRELAKIAQSNGANGSGGLNQNPVFQEMKLNVINLENDIAAINVRVENYQQKVTNLKSKINLIPEIEAKLTALNRGYQITKQKYEEMLRRRESALLAEKADLSVDDIQFKVIDPPRAKPKPVGPNRVVLNTLVLLVGLGTGISFAFILSQFNAVILTPFQLSQISGYPVLGSVSLNGNAGFTRKNKLKSILFACLLVILILMYGGLILLETTNTLTPQIRNVTQGVIS